MSVSACSPSALVYAYASGQPTLAARRSSGRDQLVLDPAFAQLLGLGGERRRAGGAELAPRFLAELCRAVAGCRLSASVSPLRRRAAATSARQLQPDVERSFADEFLGSVAAAVAGDVARAHGDEVRRDAQLVGTAARCGSGPSRLISTARSSGESNDTVAAEWMTTSAVAKIARSCVGQAEPVARLTSPATVTIRRAVISANVSVEVGRTALFAEAIERVVLEQLLLDAGRCGRAAAVADQQDQARSRGRRAAVVRRARCRRSRSTR